MVKRPFEATLQDGPDALNAVGVSQALDVLIGRMIQGFMRIPLLGQQAVGAVVVRVEGAPGRTVV